MLDFSWSEFLVVIVVAVIAVGPKQLPEVLHGLGRMVRRLQYMKYAMTRQFDDFMDQSDLRELRDQTRKFHSDVFDEIEGDEEFMKSLSGSPVERLPEPKADKDDPDRS